MSDVLVVAEQLNGSLDDVTFELLGKGRELADSLGGSLQAVLMGSGVKELANQLGAADTVLLVDHPALANFNPETYSKALAEVVKSQQPGVTLVPYSSMGMDMASAISVDLDLPLISYGVDVKAEGGAITAVSQLYGGKMNVESAVDGGSCVISVMGGAFPADALGEVFKTKTIFPSRKNWQTPLAVRYHHHVQLWITNGCPKPARLANPASK